MRCCATFVTAVVMVLIQAGWAHAEQGEAEEQAPPAEDAPAEPQQPSEPGETPESGGGEGERAEPAEEEPAGEAPPQVEPAGEEPAEEPTALPEAPAPEQEPREQAEPVLPAPEPAGPETLEPNLEEGEEREESERGAETEASGREHVGAERVWSNALPFRSSVLIYENIFSAYQMNRGSELTYNPYYAMSLSLRPRWYFTDALSARLRFDVETELTNSDETTQYHETRLSDLLFDLVYDPIVEIPVVNLNVGAGLRLQLPTSPQAQAETMYVGLGPQVRLSRVFDVLDGLLIYYSFRYMKYLNRYTTLQRQTNPYSCVRGDPACQAHNQLGDPARSHGFFNQIMLQLDFLERLFRPMHFAVMVLFYNYLTYGAPDATVPIMGGAEAEVEHIENPVNHTASIWYVIELGIDITDYLGIGVGVSTFSPQLRPDSTYRQPFFNRYSNLYVDLTLDVERLVAAFRR
jgi:hypothetical protein